MFCLTQQRIEYITLTLALTIDDELVNFFFLSWRMHVLFGSSRGARAEALEYLFEAQSPYKIPFRGWVLGLRMQPKIWNYMDRVICSIITSSSFCKTYIPSFMLLADVSYALIPRQ